jgi:hypothetical protein
MGGQCGAYGKRRGTYRALVGKTEKRDHLEELGIDGKIILKRYLK